jgi:hypothetical protein
MALVLVIAGLSLSCGGGSGGGGVTSVAPANVAGYWVSSGANNAGSAILNNCTGDFAVFNGMTVAGAVGTSNCVNAAPPYTSQSGASFTLSPVNYSCDNGDYGSHAGGGTINGNALSGQWDTISTANGYAEISTFTAIASGTNLSVSESRLTASGAINGKCDITPPLNSSFVISSTAPASVGVPDSIRLGDRLIRGIRQGQPLVKP